MIGAYQGKVWGVPIPIIYCEDGTPIVEKEVFDHIADIIGEKGSAAWFELSEKELLPEGYTNSHSPNGIYTKEKDIMDVWFDSGSSFLSVDKNRNRPFPADLYLEGNDQYRGWYNSSLILSIATTGIKPCKKIITHGMMVDANGEKFSKSKGNGVDPNKICSTYGADIFRFWVASVDFTQETRLSEDLIKICSENYRKIRNTFKFMLANLYDSKDEFADLTGNIELGMVDKLILNELGLVVKNVDKAYNNCDFNIACSTILNFVVNDLSAFYLKIAKDFLYCERKDSKLRKAIQYTMLKITKDLAIMLSPIIPFTTDEVNDHLPPYAKIEKNIALGDFPIEEFDAKLHEEYLTLNNIMKKVKVEVESLVQSKEINSFSEAEVDYKPEENEKEADKFLEMLDLIKVKDRHPMSLSGGQKQRVAIASAIASGRSVLFLDEPTSGLDHKHMLEVAEVLREVWDTGISVYVITHDLELIIECCTDVIHFENGTIADQYQMDAEGMEKIRKYFMQGKCCGKWSKSD